MNACRAKLLQVQLAQRFRGSPEIPAWAAVRQRRYRPMLINGVPVEVQSTVDVVFTLDQPPPTTDTPMLPPTQESRGIAGPK